MKFKLKKVFGLFPLLLGVVSPFTVNGMERNSGYYGGVQSAEILLNGRIIVGGIGERYDMTSNKMVSNAPTMMVEYKNKLYRCHVTLNIDVDVVPQNRDGFEVHCWGRKDFTY